MRKIVPLLIMLLCVLMEAHAQVPVFDNYVNIVQTTEGFTETLAVGATGPGPISYQWQKEGVNIPGATSDFYRIVDVQLNDAGTYTLIATNPNGSATATITLEVNENLPPSTLVMDQPTSDSKFTPGTEAHFFARADDPNWTSLNFVWTIEYHDGGTVTPVEIAFQERLGDRESAGYFIVPPDLVPTVSSFYRVRVTVSDHLGESLTTSADMYWSGNLNTNPPEIDEHPEDATVAVGSPVTFSVTAQMATSYQWAHNGTNIAGATSETYQISSVQLSDAGTYKVFVSNAAGTVESDEATLTVTGGGPVPVFGSYLAIVNTTEGFTETLAASATGPGPISYQWKKEGVNIPGATSDFYQIGDIQLDDAGTYTLVATNSNGSATATITLEVDENSPPSTLVMDSPGPTATFTPGTEFSFSAYAEDPDSWSTLNFVWTIEYHDGGTITPVEVAHQEEPGEGESAGYFIVPPDLVPTATSFYRIRVTVNDHLNESLTTYKDVYWSGDLNSNPPEIEEQPQGATVAAGSSVTFTVNARMATSYQWAHNGTNIAGATSATYQISAAQLSDAGTYKVFVSNAAGTVESEDAVLTVEAVAAPVITDQPDDVMVEEGASATFSVTATSAVSYQWTFEGANIPGATSATYQINAVQFSHAGTYKVLVTNAGGTTESDEAELTVVEDKGIIVLKTNPANLKVNVNEEMVMTRFSFEGVAGSQVNIGPSTPQTVNGVTYAFSNWAHGGAPYQDFTVPRFIAHYTINYSYPLTGPWRTTEVGYVNLHGSAAHNNGTYTLSATGNDIWNTADAFRFVYQSYHGDVDIRAQVTSLTNPHVWAKAGVMIRNSTDPRAKNVMTLISASSGASFQRRVDAGGTTAATIVPASAPTWVRLVRTGNTFSSYISSNGTDWTVVGTPQNVTMNERIYIGLAVTGHNSSTHATATFTNLSVSAPNTLAARTTAKSEEDAAFDVYPNPVSGNTVQVQLSNGKGARKLEIVNIFGRVVYQQNVSDVSDADVDIQALPQGVYVVRLSDEVQVQTRSLIRK